MEDLLQLKFLVAVSKSEVSSCKQVRRGGRIQCAEQPYQIKKIRH